MRRTESTGISLDTAADEIAALIDVTLSSSRFKFVREKTVVPDVKRKEVFGFTKLRPRQPYNPIPVRRK